MGKQLTDLTFEHWLAHVFDHPVDDSKRAWYWDLDADEWDGPAADTIQFLTQAFENAADVFQPYSDAQLNRDYGLLQIIPARITCLHCLTPACPGPRDGGVSALSTNYLNNVSPNVVPHI